MLQRSVSVVIWTIDVEAMSKAILSTDLCYHHTQLRNHVQA